MSQWCTSFQMFNVLRNTSWNLIWQNMNRCTLDQLSVVCTLSVTTQPRTKEISTNMLEANIMVLCISVLKGAVTSVHHSDLVLDTILCLDTMRRKSFSWKTRKSNFITFKVVTEQMSIEGKKTLLSFFKFWDRFSCSFLGTFLKQTWFCKKV